MSEGTYRLTYEKTDHIHLPSVRGQDASLGSCPAHSGLHRHIYCYAQYTNSYTDYTPTEVIEQTAVPGAVEVKVTLVEFRFISSMKVFHAGIPYHFVISNRGQDIHEFMIMPDKPDGTPQPPDVQFKGMLMELEPIMPGTTWTVNYTFSPAATGRFEIACQMCGHYKAGMRLPIVVTSQA